MAELKTQPNEASVGAFLDSIEDERRRADCRDLVELMGAITGEKPKMWGTSIVGFGSYHYKYASGREGDWFVTGFAPRKNDLTLYIMSGFEPHGELMAKLGKHKTGKGCLYVKSLEAVDRKVLERLIRASITHVRSLYG
ncbi:MAG: DUF1801 domain-containing protein [Fimbriimonadaceae bacterium]|nr:DUF1801 domain-containing protein [Chthonomonadaceae bacterium]MCO5296602.1 DUF1801 domain-containing protein [Fimbriimonadaceae bacterium]